MEKEQIKLGKEDALGSKIRALKVQWDKVYPTDGMLWRELEETVYKGYTENQSLNEWGCWMIWRKTFRDWVKNNKKTSELLKHAYASLRKNGCSTLNDYDSFTKDYIDSSLENIVKLYEVLPKDMINRNIEFEIWKKGNRKTWKKLLESADLSNSTIRNKLKTENGLLEDLIISDKRFSFSKFQAWLLISHDDYLKWKQFWIDNIDIDALQEKHPLFKFERNCLYGDFIDSIDLYVVLRDRWVKTHSKYFAKQKLEKEKLITEKAENEYWQKWIYIPLLALLKKQINELKNKFEKQNENQDLTNQLSEVKELEDISDEDLEEEIEHFFHSFTDEDVWREIMEEEEIFDSKNKPIQESEIEDVIIKGVDDHYRLYSQWAEQYRTVQGPLYLLKDELPNDKKRYLRILQDIYIPPAHQRRLLSQEFELLKQFDNIADKVYDSYKEWRNEYAKSPFIIIGGKYKITDSSDDIQLPLWDDFIDEYIKDIILKDWVKENPKRWHKWVENELHIYYLENHYLKYYPYTNSSGLKQDYIFYNNDDMPFDLMMQVWQENFPHIHRQIIKDAHKRLKRMLEIQQFARVQFQGIEGVKWLYEHRDLDIFQRWMDILNLDTKYDSSSFRYFSLSCYKDSCFYNNSLIRLIKASLSQYYNCLYQNKGYDVKQKDNAKIWKKEYKFLLAYNDWINYIFSKNLLDDIDYKSQTQLDDLMNNV